MATRAGLVLSVGMLAAAASGAAEIGAVQIDPAGAVVLLSIAPLRAKGRVYYQFLTAAGSVACCKQVPFSSLVPVESDGLAIDVTSGEPLLRFRVTSATYSWQQEPFIGLAIFAERDARVRQVTRNSLTATVDGSSLRVRSCTSEEGLHIKGADTVTRHRSEIYIGVGYAIEGPMCKC